MIFLPILQQLHSFARGSVKQRSCRVEVCRAVCATFGLANQRQRNPKLMGKALRAYMGPPLWNHGDAEALAPPSCHEYATCSSKLPGR